MNYNSYANAMSLNASNCTENDPVGAGGGSGYGDYHSGGGIGAGGSYTNFNGDISAAVCFNCKQTGHFAKDCTNARVEGYVDVSGHNSHAGDSSWDSSKNGNNGESWTPQALRAQLQHFYGYGQFRNGQLSAIMGALQGEDVFAIMPTGGGKSLCYQLPALVEHGVSIVISPLISLVQDPVEQVNAVNRPKRNSRLPELNTG